MSSRVIQRVKLIKAINRACEKAEYEGGVRDRLNKVGKTSKNIAYGVGCTEVCGCPLVEAFGTTIPEQALDPDFRLTTISQSGVFMQDFDQTVAMIVGSAAVDPHYRWGTVMVADEWPEKQEQ